MRDERPGPDKFRRELAWFFAGLGGLVAFIGWVHWADLRWANDPGNPDPRAVAAVYGADAALLIAAGLGLWRRARGAAVLGTIVSMLNLAALVLLMILLLAHLFPAGPEWALVCAGLWLGLCGAWGLASRCRACLKQIGDVEGREAGP